MGHVACVGRGDLHGGFWWRKGPHSRWEDNIEMEFIGEGGDGVDWINLAGDRDRWQTVWNTVMMLGSIQGGEFVDWLREYWIIRDKSAACIWLVGLLFSSFLLVIYPAFLMETL